MPSYWPAGLNEKLGDTRRPLGIIQDIIKDVAEGSNKEYELLCRPLGADDYDLILRYVKLNTETTICRLRISVDEPYPIYINNFLVGSGPRYAAGNAEVFSKKMADIMGSDEMETACRNLILSSGKKKKSWAEWVGDLPERFLDLIAGIL